MASWYQYVSTCFCLPLAPPPTSNIDPVPGKPKLTSIGSSTFLDAVGAKVSGTNGCEEIAWKNIKEMIQNKILEYKISLTQYENEIDKILKILKIQQNEG